MSESASNVISAELAEDIDRLKAEVDTKNRQMGEVRRRAEEIEMNFREVSSIEFRAVNILLVYYCHSSF